MSRESSVDTCPTCGAEVRIVDETTKHYEATAGALYKALTSGGVSPVLGYEWPSPSKTGDGWEPGEWVDAGEGELVECGHGLHCCTVGQLPRWLSDELYVLEPAEGTDRLVGNDKIVVRKGRLVRPVETWNETTARLFAADCAEMVLPVYGDEYLDDDRPSEAIEVARAYARGEADDDELRAARDAAWATARAAARFTARAAAWAAARDAAWAPARYTTRAAAWAAARGAVDERLVLYLEHGEAAAEEPVPDIREVSDA